MRLIGILKWYIKWYLNPYYWFKPYFISFVEEGIMNGDYVGYIGGRVEVWTQWSKYDIDEYRFLTRDIVGYYAFREKWDTRNMSIYGLMKFKKSLKKFNCNIK